MVTAERVVNLHRRREALLRLARQVATEREPGGLFKTLAPLDHERVVRFVFGELRSRQRL